MTKNVEVLDCTLRDGGRIIDCKFSDYEITNIIDRLTSANINYVEVGFLRDAAKVHYNGGSTFFTSVKQIEPFLVSKGEHTRYSAFIDYGMFDFDALDECDGKSVDVIRVGFTKKDYLNRWDDVKKCFHAVKEKGYSLFVQGVNSLGYTAEQLNAILRDINEIKPEAFGIVDTYGAMYLDDVDGIYEIINSALLPDIKIDFHSHNNKQMAFALAQKVIDLSQNCRKIIIDATLEGMGKSAGNLNLELIVEYLTQKKCYNYDFDGILDTIDEFIYPFKREKHWGYSVPAFLGGIYKTHPNNVIYLTEKFRLSNRDIKNILSMLDEETAQTYDYDLIEEKYLQYGDTDADDLATIGNLKAKIGNREILVLAPGHTLNKYATRIRNYVEKNDPVVISVNFETNYKGAYSFFGNKKRYDSAEIKNPHRLIAVSNTKPRGENIIVSYSRLIDRRYKLFDNSTVMLLNLLKRMHVDSITLAGFDGYSKRVKNNYFNEEFFNERHVYEYGEINREIITILKQYTESVKETCSIKFLTPSIYQKGLNEN